MRVDVTVKCEPSTSMRARQVASMFDVPPSDKLSHSWSIEAPLESREWDVGLIVGPSGSGKSVIAREMFGDAVGGSLEWSSRSVVDDVSEGLTVSDIVEAFQAVGFNTIPSWLKPFGVLSNGEQFRVTLARQLLEGGDLVVVDEFTSVVDRQVAKIASHAVQKFARSERRRRFVAVSCHSDIIEWLQPDWIIDPSANSFDWRSVQPRPRVECRVGRVSRSEWSRFARYHYLSADLPRASQCFGLWAGDSLVCFAGILHFPHAKVRNIRRVSRVVTLPDWQGLGLSFALLDKLGSAYRAAGFRFRMYPAHPPYVRSFDRSPVWSLRVRPGKAKTTQGRSRKSTLGKWPSSGYRPCAVFEYIGEPDESVRQALEIVRFQ